MAAFGECCRKDLKKIKEDKISDEQAVELLLAAYAPNEVQEDTEIDNFLKEMIAESKKHDELVKLQEHALKSRADYEYCGSVAETAQNQSVQETSEEASGRGSEQMHDFFEIVD